MRFVDSFTMAATWVVIASVPLPASAQDAEAEAEIEVDAGTVDVAETPAVDAASEARGRLHFQAGASHYDAGDYEDALREFERAYEISHRPELLYNFSLCYQQLGQLDRAIETLDRYLAEVDDIPNRDNLARRLGNLRARQLEPEEVEPEERSSVPVGAIAGFAVAGAGLITFAVAGGLALSEKGNLEDMGCPEVAGCNAGSLRTRALVADIGLGVMLAGAVTGVVLLFVGRGSEESDEDVSAVPFIGPRAGGLGLAGRF